MKSRFKVLIKHEIELELELEHELELLLEHEKLLKNGLKSLRPVIA